MELATFVQRQFPRLVLVGLALGFAVLLAELLITNHTDGIQLIAPVSSAVGIALSLAALMLRRRGVLLAVLFGLLTVTGLVGVFEHNEERFGGEASRPNTTSVRQVSARFAAQGNDEDEANEAPSFRERGEGERTPPLAPLSLSGLALLGALATLARREGAPLEHLDEPAPR